MNIWHTLEPAAERGTGMQIDERLINYLEELSCLALSDEEKRRISGDLEKILRYMERLGELDTAGVPGRSHPFDNVSTYRHDEAAASFDRGLILKNAPHMDGGMFVAPKARVES